MPAPEVDPMNVVHEAAGSRRVGAGVRFALILVLSIPAAVVAALHIFARVQANKCAAGTILVQGLVTGSEALRPPAAFPCRCVTGRTSHRRRDLPPSCRP